MTLTAPNCPMADDIIKNVNDAIKNVENVRSVNINLVFDHHGPKDMLSDEALLELGLL